MAKTTKGAAKTAAKIARGKAKVARKCGKVSALRQAPFRLKPPFC